MLQSQADASAGLVTVTELMQLRTLGIGIGEVSWSRVRMTSDNWLCIVHRRATHDTDRRCLQATVLDPHGSRVQSLQMEGLTLAQVSPGRNVIALSTRDKIFSVCLEKRQIISWNRFPCEVEYWSWVSKSVIGIIGKERIYLWHMDADSLSYVVNRSSRLLNTQITNYQVSFDQKWHILQALKCDAGSSIITGIVQIYCPTYNHSTILEAEATCITSYRFSSNSYESQVLVLVNRTTAISTKISVVELGPQMADRNLLVSRSEGFHWPDPDDIATNVVCSAQNSLIYLLSKKGVLFVFALETCTPLVVNERVCSDIIFNVVLDNVTKGVLAVARNGQILSIHAQVDAAVMDKEVVDPIISLNAEEAVQQEVDDEEEQVCDQVTRL